MGYICMKPSLDYESSCFLLYYDEKQNVMMDEDNNILYNIFDYIEPRDLFLFKVKKEYMVVRSKLDDMDIALVWPEHDES